MLKYYLKFAIRNFRSNKVIFTGSLATLCLGALCISLLFSYVNNELTMDNFHKREKDIYMVITKRFPMTEWSFPLEFVTKDYPEIENSTSLIFFNKDKTKLKYKEDIFTPTGTIVDSSFFKVFDFKLLIGDTKTVLNNPQAIILSEAFSKKLFGDENPIGKTVDFEIRMYQGIHTVKGIVKIPSNSSIKFDYIIPKKQLSIGSYGNASFSFFKAIEGFNEAQFKEKIKGSNNKIPNHVIQLTESLTSIIGLDDIYFSNELNMIKKFVPFGSGNIKNIQVLFIIMLVILFVSVLNYSNLQIVNTNAVLKYIAIAKVNGAEKRHLFLQKLVETLVLIVIAALLITLGYNLILPKFNVFINLTLTPPLEQVFLLNLSIVLIIAALGMVYPALILIRFSIIKNIKQNAESFQKIGGRSFTIILQYSLVFVLLISALIVNNQLGLILSKDLGFNKDGIMKVKLFYYPPFNHNSIYMTPKQRKEEREKLLQIPQYINSQLASFSCIDKLTQGHSPINIYQLDWKFKKSSLEYESHNTHLVTPSHKEVFDFKLIEGRFFENDRKQGNKIVINEAMVKHWGIKDISAVRIFGRVGKYNEYEIIGVVKDYNYEHLSAKPKPLIMLRSGGLDKEYFLKFHKGQTQEGIQLIETLFKEINPNQLFRYSFLSDEIAALYQKEKRLSSIYIIFTIIALLISAIGLFTIALYDTQRRDKEIGIRKVNGATINEIMYMLNKDFLKWVVIAYVIACPITYFAMSKWLENFAYKTALSWWIFAMAGVFTLVIALLTVSWQSYSTAKGNPVEALLDE